ncbi:MAG: universal stress protein [Bacillaceae bacterium]|nr:universal stress protein [Bacillaceae bacterium]
MDKNIIIVPVDGSTYALEAVHYAVKTAKAFNSILLLLNVQPKHNEATAHLLSENELIQIQEDEANRIFQKVEPILKDENISYQTKIRVGLPSIEITSEAKEQQAEAIIMGTRGMGPVVGQALGSVSYSVSHLTPCPLILVPAKV